MCAKHEQDAEAIFNEAIKIESDAERATFIKAACADDTTLLARVEALLKAPLEHKSSRKLPPVSVDGTLDAPPLTEGPGMRIGRYKLLQLIGEGGFGVVYMAEQEEPIRRKVALKIIKLGMDTKQVVARFEAERQALAMMDHPNIAKVLDAGATDTGRPYFVMELVKGIPITEYCDKNNLDTRRRLGLFIDVCKAVQHAHQKGIIHRDIKPSNVMITLHDGKPVPKIIDFGIAKATQQRLTEKTLFTEYRQFIGTPEYMSPEQAEMSGLDIDTRTDIYSLGVLLYELLTGTKPFEADKLRSAAYDEIRRIIREDEPPKPSTRLNTLGDALTDIAKHRDVQPGELYKIVRGELDWVVMKTLEKDRTRRYETANELAMDIERHLGDEPVSAGPPTMRYRLTKFVRRHRAGVAGAATVAAAIVVGFVVSTAMYFRAEQALRREAVARTEAERQASISQTVNDFLNKDLLASVSPARAKGRIVTVMDILDNAAEKLEGKFKDTPSIEASIRDTLGATYLSLGKYKAAEPHLVRVLQLRRGQFGAEHPNTLKSMAMLGELYCGQARYNEAEPLFVKVLETRRRVLGEEHRDTLASMSSLGWLYYRQGRYGEAEPLLVKTLETQRRVLGEENPDTLNSMNSLGWLYYKQRRYSEAEPLWVKALETGCRILGEEHPETLDSMRSLGGLYYRQGRYIEAGPLFVKALEIRRRVLGEEHPDTLTSMNNLGGVYERLGRYKEAESLFVKALEIRRRVLGEEHPDTLISMNSLGWLYCNQGHYNEAEPLFVKALEGRRRVLGEEHPDTLTSMNSLGWLLQNQGRYTEAEPLFVKVLEIRRRILGKEHPDTLNSIKDLTFLVEHLGSLGMEQYKAGAYEKAVATLKRVDEYRRTVLNKESLPRDIAYTAMALHRLGRSQEAQASLGQLRQMFEDDQYASQEYCLYEAEQLFAGENSKVYLAWEHIKAGKLEEALHLVEEMRALKDPNITGRIEGVIRGLARAYYHRGRNAHSRGGGYAETIGDYETAVRVDKSYARAFSDLAYLQAACPAAEFRDANKAVENATKSCNLTNWKDYRSIATLAAVYAEVGDFASAAKWQKEAIGLLPPDEHARWQVNYESRLKLYESGKPYHMGNLWSFSTGQRVAWYTFDEDKEGQVVDSSGNNLHGKLVGDAKIISDPERGHVLCLDGNGDYVDCGNDPAFNFIGSATVAAWIKVKALDKDWQAIVNKRDGMGIASSGLVQWGNVDGKTDMNDGKWHHVAGVHDGTKFYLYVDGKLDNSKEALWLINTTNEFPVLIGENAAETGHYWNGLIDDVRIYSYALSEAEVKALYATKEPPPPGKVSSE